MLQVSPVRAFSDNYIWLIRAPANPAVAVVVDPGDDRPVEQALQAQGLRLGAILVTHYHADHVGGVEALAVRHGAHERRRHLRDQALHLRIQLLAENEP